jgi:hypothetical protein
MSDMPLEPVADAALAKVQLPPALVEMIQDDPELLVKFSRGQLAIVQQRMVQMLLGNKDATVAAYVQVHERLSKNARIEPKEGVTGGAQQVVINIIRGGGRAPVTIEGDAVKVDADA